jgi:hypothetical protein
MTDAAAVRVARGAAWLDKHYPNWWKTIDLGTLNVASCTRCVLGQVFTGTIPADEQDQIMAQVIAVPGTFQYRTPMAEARRMVKAGTWNGFVSLVEFHSIMFRTSDMGFAAGMMFDPVTGRELESFEQFDLLNAEWTRLIIERRINENLAEVTQLWADNRAQVAQLVAA